MSTMSIIVTNIINLMLLCSISFGITACINHKRNKKKKPPTVCMYLNFADRNNQHPGARSVEFSAEQQPCAAAHKTLLVDL